MQNNYFTLVSKSSWLQNARDSTVCFKAPGPGTYLLTTEFLNELPEKNRYLLQPLHETGDFDDGGGSGGSNGDLVSTDVQIDRLILRAYSTRKVFVSPPGRRRMHKVLIPAGNRYPRAIRWSMIGLQRCSGAKSLAQKSIF